MKSRCYAPSYKNSYYQKDGIKVCDEWLHDYERFLSDMGKMPDETYSIERVDIHGNYCKDNCKWIPLKEQQINRRITRFFTHNGETKCLKDWARFYGINYGCLYARVIKRGVPFEIAIDQSKFDNSFEFNGERHTMSDWCKILNLDPGIVFSRIHRGWSKSDALLIPIKSVKK